MTHEEMTAVILNHWKVNHRAKVKHWTPAELRQQAAARAQLAEAEMQALMEIGVDRQTAWVDVRNQLALAAP